MSFLKKLFGGGDKSATSSAKPLAEADYNGFQIATAPMEEGGQFRVCAMIHKQVGDDTLEHKLIRADVCSTAQEASDIAMRKAQQMIDERGESLFG